MYIPVSTASPLDCTYTDVTLSCTLCTFQSVWPTPWIVLILMLHCRVPYVHSSQYGFPLGLYLYWCCTVVSSMTWGSSHHGLWTESKYWLDQEVDGWKDPEEGSEKKGRNVGKNVRICSASRGIRKGGARAPGAPIKGPKKILKMCFSINVSMTLPTARHGVQCRCRRDVW